MIQIRALVEADYPQVKAIYQQGIDWGNATFKGQTGDWAHFDKDRLKVGRLVALVEGEIVAWACLTEVSKSEHYRGVGETTIYVDSARQGKGIGLVMLKALVSAAEQAGFWTLQARIFPENIASIRLHEKAGFSVFGLHEKLGKHHGVWRDVVLLERRSDVIGQD